MPSQHASKTHFKESCLLLADVVSKAKRSKMMAGIRSKDTRPEIKIRKALHRLGFRYRLHKAALPGRPDLALPKYRAVIMVNGCFWHGHGCHLFKWPSTRPEFWRRKINRNRLKDSETIALLKEDNWRILVVWECALKGRTKLSFEDLILDIAGWIESKNCYKEIEGRAC